MGQPAARLGDMHVCPMVTPGLPPIPHVGGPIITPGAPNVLIGGMPAATVGCTCTCVGPPDVIIKGSLGVMIGGRPAARMGDNTAHGGMITFGLPTVLIGDIGMGNLESLHSVGQLAINENISKAERYEARLELIARTKLNAQNLTENQKEKAIQAANRLEENNKAIERARLADHIYSFGKVPIYEENIERNFLPDKKIEKTAKVNYDKNGIPIYSKEDGSILRNEDVSLKNRLDKNYQQMANNPPEGWIIKEPFYKDPDTGFAYVVYESTYEKDAKPVLVFRGTDNEDEAGKDWKVNGEQSIGKTTEQYNQSINQANLMDEKYPNGYEIAGHSKAGGQAAASGIISGKKTYTFNAAGVHNNTLAKYGKTTSDANKTGPNGIPIVSAFNFEHDLVSNGQDTVVPVLKAGLIASPSILAKISGIGLMAIGAGPSASGNRRVLKSVDENGNNIDFKVGKWVDFHGMPYIINSMEAEKKADIQALSNM